MTLMLPRARSFPLLSNDILDYRPGEAYNPDYHYDQQQDRQRLTIYHKLTSGNLVARLAEQGQVRFCCTLASPYAAYREVFVAEESVPKIEPEGTLTVLQHIFLNKDVLKPPVHLQPAITTHNELITVQPQATDGLDDVWRDSELLFPPVALLAVAPFSQLGDPVQSMLRIVKDESGSLPAGSFEVTEIPDEGFYFQVRTATDLYESLSNPGHATLHRDSIFSAALAQGFVILQGRYADRELWREHPNLICLHTKLREKKLVSWDEDDFSPNKTVAAFHPHILDTGFDSDDEDE